MKDRKKVYIVMDDYTPDAGSTIYGVYSTNGLAEKAVEELESEDNEYGRNMNEEGTIDIRSEYLDF